MYLRTLSVFFVGKISQDTSKARPHPRWMRRQGPGLVLGVVLRAVARQSWHQSARFTVRLSARALVKPAQRLGCCDCQATQPLGGVVGGCDGTLVGSMVGTPGVPGVPGSVGVGVGAGLVLPAIGTAAAARFVVGLLLGSAPTQWALTKAVMASTMSHCVSGESRRRLPCSHAGELGVPK